MTNRLGRIMNSIINKNQSAFILGRLIHDNIMLAQELIRGYGRKYISSRCKVQMDIKKSYDTVEWPALSQIICSLGFPQIL